MIQRLWLWWMLAVLLSIGFQHTAIADEDVVVIETYTENEVIIFENIFDEEVSSDVLIACNPVLCPDSNRCVIETNAFTGCPKCNCQPTVAPHPLFVAPLQLDPGHLQRHWFAFIIRHFGLPVLPLRTTKFNAITCDTCGTPQDGSTEGDDPLNPIGTICEYECDDGFTLEGAEKSQCLMSGEWSNPTPLCKPITCDTCGKPQDGSTEGDDPLNSIGTICEYECDDGFTLEGSKTSQCLMSGEWSNPTPLCKPCGTPINGPLRTIVGGQNADPFEWPWMVLLRNTSDKHYITLCGGVLLTERHVLTAAHCFTSDHPKDVKQDMVVTLGEYNYNRKDGNEENFTISKLEKHPMFENNPAFYRNDLAILTLEKSTNFNKAIRPICLPSKNVKKFTALNATTLGWGRNTSIPNLPFPDIIQEVETIILSHKNCMEGYYNKPPKKYKKKINSKKEICAAPYFCSGDSGGPLMVQIDKRWTVIGIVANGQTTCKKLFPDVYTRVDGFLPWISNIIS